MPTTVEVEGYTEFRRAMRGAGKDIARDAAKELRAATDVVRLRAEELAASNIRNVTPRWGRIRLGTTTRIAYIVPRSRREHGSPRPNFGTLLLERAMVPAADDKEDEIARAMEHFIDTFIAKHDL